jgi:predicted acetyltransferase
MDLNPPLKPEGEVISMNFHLTSLEKKRIHKAIELPENKAAINKLKKILL